MIRDHPHVAVEQPFQYVLQYLHYAIDTIWGGNISYDRIKVKEIRSAYNVDQVFSLDIPSLQHENDGLIYTCVNTPYTAGTDSNVWVNSFSLVKSKLNQFFFLSTPRIKWKPPSENSIDFKLVLRFPPVPSNPSQPDYRAKPVFLLHVWCGDQGGVPRYEQYDEMYVEDDEWEKSVLSIKFCRRCVYLSIYLCMQQDESFGRTIRRSYCGSPLGSFRVWLANDAVPQWQAQWESQNCCREYHYEYRWWSWEGDCE